MGRLALISVALVLGCSSKGPSAAAAPGGGSVSTRGGSTPADAGVTADGGHPGDGGKADGGSKGLAGTECVDVPPTTFMGEDTPMGQFFNAISSPADFSVTRVKTSWDKDCTTPTIRIEMSDGSCPSGSGHALVFSLDADSIKNSAIRLGQNSIADAAEPDGGAAGIEVRYVRPLRLNPHGTWGSCGAASGTVDLIGDLDTIAGTMLNGRFDMELASCDMTPQPLQTLVGSFSVVLRQGESEACPGK